MLLCCQFLLFGAVIARPGSNLGREGDCVPQAAGGRTGTARITG
jgi:hypothetical protein